MPVDPRALRRRPNELGPDASAPSAPLLPGGPGPSPTGPGGPVSLPPQGLGPGVGPGMDPGGIVPPASALGPDMLDLAGNPLAGQAGPGPIDGQVGPGGLGGGGIDPSTGEPLDNAQVAGLAPDPGMAAEPGRMAAAIGQMIAQQRQQQIQQIDAETEQALQQLTQIMQQAATVNPTLDESAMPQATPSPSGY